MKPLAEILPTETAQTDDATTSPINIRTSSAASPRTYAERTGAIETADDAPADECTICKGTGFVVPDLPIDDPEFGKAVSCQCQSHARLERRLQKIQRLGTLDSMSDLTFETFIPEPSHLSADRAHNLRRAYETCVYFAQEPEGWLLLTGTYGCGKTHLAAAIASARLDLGKPAVFMVVPDLLDHLRATFSPNSEIAFDDLFEQLRSTPLLVLDDLGAQSGSPWAQEKLFQLLNHRYNAHLPTVITTNQRLDEIDPRLRSRLMDMGLVKQFPILAPDFRTGSNPSQSDLSSLRLHRDARFETFDVRRGDLAGDERANLQDVVDACHAFAQQPHGWIVLAGANGCGKTHLAAAIANYQSDSAMDDVMLIVVPDLLDRLRAAFDPKANTSYDRRFDEIKNVALLVLDDLGTESATPWAREKLFQLLNYRYSALLPTVITTSSKPEQIEPWLRTRMFDVNRCQFWGIIAPGYRGSRSQQQSKGTSRARLRR